MGWQGTLVLTLWLPKVFGLSPTKQCSFFLFFYFFFPSHYRLLKSGNCASVWVSLSLSLMQMPSLLQGCHFLECASTTVSRAPLQPPWNNKPKLQSYPTQTMSFSSSPSLSFPSTFFGTFSQNSRTQLCTGSNRQTDNFGLSYSSLFAGNDGAC